MAQDFIIKKGLSERLFKLTQDQLEENAWYLTLDTAEVYIALRQLDGRLALKKLNECNIDTDFDMDSFEDRLAALEVDRTHVYGYKKDFPKIGERDHIYIAEDEHRTYVFVGNTYLHIADKFDSEDHDNNPETPEVRIIFGGSAK